MRDAYPDLWSPTENEKEEGIVKYDHFELDSDLQYTARWDRGSHFTWYWDFGDGNITCGEYVSV